MHGTCDAQGIRVGVSVLRLISREGDMTAGLALISSIRKRLVNMPADLAADEVWRVRCYDLSRVALSQQPHRCQVM